MYKIILVENANEAYSREANEASLVIDTEGNVLKNRYGYQFLDTVIDIFNAKRDEDKEEPFMP